MFVFTSTFLQCLDFFPTSEKNPAREFYDPATNEDHERALRAGNEWRIPNECNSRGCIWLTTRGRMVRHSLHFTTQRRMTRRHMTRPVVGALGINEHVDSTHVSCRERREEGSVPVLWPCGYLRHKVKQLGIGSLGILKIISHDQFIRGVEELR